MRFGQNQNAMVAETVSPIRNVVVTHRGYRPYLQTCLRRAELASGGGRVILLGDSDNQHIGTGEHHCNLIRGMDALESFCEYVLDIYRSPARLQRLCEINRKKFSQFWISDMALLAAWSAEGNYPTAFLENTVADGVAFDSCIDSTEGYVPCGYLPLVLKQWKKITFRDGIPYATVRPNHIEVPMKCLHYHGRMKQLMDRHHCGQSDDWTVANLMLKSKIADYPRKIKMFKTNYPAMLIRGLRGKLRTLNFEEVEKVSGTNGT